MESKLANALPILASAYGQQFGVTVKIGGDGAWTDGSTIQIPLIQDPELRDVVLGYLVHEAAHIRMTDFRAYGETSGVLQRLVNILEDVRIERGMYESDYPGTKSTLSAVWAFGGTKRTPEEAAQADNLASLFTNYLLRRVRQEQFGLEITRPHLASIQSALEKELPAGFFVRLDVLLDQHFNSMASTRDAVHLAKAILEALKQAEEEANQEKSQQEQESNDGSSESDSESGSGNSDGSDGDSQEDSSGGAGNSDGSDDDAQADSDDSSGNGSGDSCSEESNSDDTGSGGSSDSNTDSGEASDSDSSSGQQPQSGDSSETSDGKGAGGGEKSLSEQIVSETDLPGDMMDNIRRALGEQAQEEQQNDPTGGTRNVDLDSRVGDEVSVEDHQRKLDGSDTLKDGVLGSSKLRAQMVGLLQAQSRSRTSHREYGKRFDTKRLARAMAGERQIWKHKEEKSMVDTSVHILLDTSGSMGDDQRIANSATVSLALAISAIPKADVAVSIFPGFNAMVSPLIKRKAAVRPNIPRFAVRAGGGTPMAEAMFYAARELSVVSGRNRKVMIVITDGAPNDGASVNYINQLVESEIDVYAIGIRAEAVRHYFKNYQVITEVGQLQSALFGLAKEFLNVA